MGQDRREDERLNNCGVSRKLKELDLSEPYIWQLAITADEYEELKAALNEYVSSTDGSMSSLLKGHSLLVMTYFAEWFKREYTGTGDGATERTLSLNTDDIKTLWNNSGINIEKYVYQSDSGIHLWQYSIYVLGGLAINQELRRNDRGRFLKGLCRIYHGEDYTLENLDEANRAIAFRKSISQKESLYEYLRTILNGKYKSNDVKTKQFLERVKSANDEVLKSKFRFEWIVSNLQYNDFMTRRLRVWLKPEEVGGGLHQYLRYDRVLLWGIQNPEQQKHLRFYIRWWNHKDIVQDIDVNHPIIDYLNTGSDNGFITMGVEKFVACKTIPVRYFTNFDVVVLDDDDQEYIAQSEDATDYIQLWRVEQWGDEWTSHPMAQHQTAVIYNELWAADQEADSSKPFRSKKEATGTHKWKWNYIYSEVTLHDAKGNEETFYNREGYDQIYAHLYDNIIRYEQGGLVRHCIEDDEEGEIADYMPLIFGKDDIRVRHFQTKDAILNAMPETETVAEQVEYRESNGRYVVWTDSEQPSYGMVSLRVSVKGVPTVLSMLYLPALEKDTPVERDLTNHTIKYRGFDGKERMLTDEIVLDEQPLAPAVEINYGTKGECGDERTVLNVYRPTTIKEVYLDGKIVSYLEDGDSPITIPYVLKRRVRLTDFSEKGYKVYDLSDFGSLFAKIGGSSGAHLTHWQHGIKWPAKRWNEEAPTWLNVSIGSACEAEQLGLMFFYWNYDENTDPVEVPYDHEMAPGSIVFQSMKQAEPPFVCIDSRFARANPFSRNKVKVSIVKCFEVARAHRIYYFAFEPLRTMVERGKMKEKLYLPLLESKDGTLTAEDIAELQRFADDFGFDWRELGINLE